MTVHKDILNFTLQHDAYQNAYKAVSDAVSMALVQGGGVVPILGPTRCGKTEVVKDICNDKGKVITGPGTLVPGYNVRYGEVSPKPSDKDLFVSILQSLNHNCKPQTPTAAIRSRIESAINDEGVQIIALDECNHCVESGANLTLRATGDHFKRLVDKTGVVLILSGLPNFQKIIDGNEQLKERTMRTIHFKPYNWANEAEREAFAAAVFNVFDHLTNEGVELDFDQDVLATQLYFLSGGRVGLVLKLLRGALSFADGNSLVSANITKAAGILFQDPAKVRLLKGDDIPDDTQQVRAYVEVMRSAGIALEPSTTMELAALSSEPI